MENYIIASQIGEMKCRSILSGFGIRKEENNNDLIKANGPGSKGGKIIGYTKSGKPVYDKFNHPEHKNFSREDHENASEIHDKHYVSLSKKYPESQRTEEQRKQLRYHAKQATQHSVRYRRMKDNNQLSKAIENIMSGFGEEDSLVKGGPGSGRKPKKGR